MVVAGDQFRRHLREVLGEADHQRKDVLGDTLRVGSRSVHDLDAAGRRRLDVDLIVADSVPADDLEVLASVEERGIDDAPGADDERVGSVDLAMERGRIQGARPAEITRVPEELQARFMHARQREDVRTAFHGVSRWLSLSDGSGRRIIHPGAGGSSDRSIQRTPCDGGRDRGGRSSCQRGSPGTRRVAAAAPDRRSPAPLVGPVFKGIRAREHTPKEFAVPFFSFPRSAWECRGQTTRRTGLPRESLSTPHRPARCSVRSERGNQLRPVSSSIND